MPTDYREPMTTLLTVEEAATSLRCHRETVRRMISDGRLPAVKLHPARRGAVRIRTEDVERLMQPPMTES